MKHSLKICLLLFIIHSSLFANAQYDVTTLINKVKEKIEKVNDYTANGVLKTDVVFIKAPVSNVTVYFKKPNRFRLVKKSGISILPKGGLSVNMSSIVGTNDFTALDAGEAVVNKVKTRVIKLLPNDENSNVVLSTLYIDEARLLIMKVTTTTRENGSYELTMKYGGYADYSLPDKVDFSFNIKEYKLPKGVTLNSNENETPAETEKLKKKKGNIEIDYSSYTINKGVDDAVFTK